MDWRKVDWAGILGSSVAECVGGRFAIALRAIVQIWAQAGHTGNAKIADELERSSESGEPPNAEAVLGDLTAPEGSVEALSFGLLILQAWKKSEQPDFELFIDTLAIGVWRDSQKFRTILSQAAWEPGKIQILCRDAGVDMTRVSFQGSAEQQWFSVLEYLRNQLPGMLLFVLYLASRRFPAEFRLRVWETT